MVSYPGIEKQHQKDLPALTAPALAIPPAFADSTHQLWSCETDDGPMVLKCCQTEVIDTSAFWQGMNSLFDIQFPDSLNSMPAIADYLRRFGALVVPEVVAAESGAFVLTRTLSGQDFTAREVTDDMVKQLATHLGQLHLQQSDLWGRFPTPHLSAKYWPSHLHNVLMSLGQQSELSVSRAMLEHVARQAASIRPQKFVPIMPDLRWDQFRLLPDGQLAVIDLDAFVTAPAQLELTLLEYLLDARQADIFAHTYSRFLPLSLNAQEREVYRLLLFLMHVLGEQDVNQWMATPHRF